MQGCAYYKKGQYDEALKNFDSVLESNPEHTDTLCMKGLVLTKLGNTDDALAFCDKTLEKNPNDIVALNNKGYLLSLLGDNQNAIEIFDKILKKEPENVPALFNNALSYSRLEKFEESVRLYSKVLEIDPQNVDALYNKGNDLFHLEKYDQAISCYDGVLAIRPSYRNAKNNRQLSEQKLQESEGPSYKDENISKAKSMIDGIRIWLDDGQKKSELKKYQIEPYLVEALPAKKEEIQILLTEAEHWIQNGMSINNLPKKDKDLTKFAKALAKFESNSKSKDKKSKRKVNGIAMLGILLVAAVIVFTYATSSVISINMAEIPSIPIDFSSYVVSVPADNPTVTEIVQKNSEFENQLESILNKKRIDLGRGPLETNSELKSVALKLSQDMAAREKIDKTLSTDGLPVTREYADKLPACIFNAQKNSDALLPSSAVNVFSVDGPMDQNTAQAIVDAWINQDVREIIVRNLAYSYIGTSVTLGADDRLYVSQLYC